MRTISKILSLTLFVGAASSFAGTVCMGETDSGKIITVDVVTVGAYGSFDHANIKVVDKDGSVLLEEKRGHAAQVASMMRADGKALAVYSSIGSDFDVFLDYLGKDYSEVEYATGKSLLEILKDSSRKKQVNNLLEIHSYKDGLKNIKLKDVVCSLDHDA